LGDLPLPIYITTSPHTVFEDVLRQAGKDPQVEICYWNDYLTAVPSVFNEDRYKLPLDDATIAGLLGATRQQVINLRKCARERLERRMSAVIAKSSVAK
jgi:hypothetical protein